MKEINKLNLREKYELAKTTSTPEILEMLSKDGNDFVRGAVANNKKTSAKALESLSFDKWKIVDNVLENTKTTTSLILKILHTTKNYYIKYTALVMLRKRKVEVEVDQNLKIWIVENI